ncbi:SDR family oxidoreductase [Iodidimonas sp. SYSU 1G8]|uniref:SDR family NAD(P)-dependent oxidoreductase n=1 Tax=Iodidimonas sp. SYSU 1G8 TaxID=3133967 RepID=UPI0031FE5DAA
MSVSLKGRTAIVTGAAVGIGNAYAKALAREGCDVAVIDIRPDIADLPKELEKSGIKSFAVQGDVSDAPTVRKFVDQVASQFGGVDILINNAGQCWVSMVDDDLEKSEKDYDGMVGTNLRGEYLMGRAVIPLMLKQGSGEIVNIGTDHGVTCGSPNEICIHVDSTCPWNETPRPTGGGTVLDIYDASKYGTYALTFAWAKALKPKNIRVNCICMGATDSHMIRGFFGERATPEEVATWMTAENSAQVVVDILKEGPKGRTGETINLCIGRPTVLEPERKPIYVTPESVGYNARETVDA